MRIIGIETSCDETGVAIYDARQGLLAHALHSQVALHADYGGVVPELASRDHVRKVLPLLREVMTRARSGPADIHGVAYTAGQGWWARCWWARRSGAAWPGPGACRRWRCITWKATCWRRCWKRIRRPFLRRVAGVRRPYPADAGERRGAIYPVGRHARRRGGRGLRQDRQAAGTGLSRRTGTGAARRTRRSGAFPLYPSHGQPAGLEFSFSGLKTHALTTLRAEPLADEQTRADIARAFEDAVVDTLAIKCRRALEQTGLARLVVAGGVSANRRLRARLDDMARPLAAAVYYPRLEFCTDNGAMIAYAGYQRLRAGQAEPLAFTAWPRWPLSEVAAPSA